MILRPKLFVCHHCIVSLKQFSGFDDGYLFSFLMRILVAFLLTRMTNYIVSLYCNVYFVGRFNYIVIIIQFTFGYHNNG